MGVTPAEALLHLLDKGGGGVCAVYFAFRESDVELALTPPLATIGSEGYSWASDGYGPFTRVLGQCVR
jgi:hypothetical protein